MQHASLADRRRGFAIHAFVYVLAIAAMVVINLVTGAPYWVVWVVPGWSIGLFAHWFFVLGPGAGQKDSASS